MQTKTAHQVWGAVAGAVSRTYPDQALLEGFRHGSGFSNMGGIIHDFVRYNDRVQHDFSARLSQGLTSAQRQLIQRVAQESAARRLPLYAVGGLPRDLWLGSKATDLDLVVEGNAIALARALADRYGGRVTAHPKFGTAKWDLRGIGFEEGLSAPEELGPDQSGHFLDLVSARSETYRHPAALPTVKPGTIHDDIRRRDFTINALALRLEGSHFGQLQDELGALHDLESGSVRVLHSRSFIDDPTRMFRAARYEQRFGFRIADETLALIPSARRIVAELSGHRIRHELDLILAEPAAAAILARLAQLNLLSAVHPSLPRGQAAFGRVELLRQVPAAAIRAGSRSDAAWLLWLMHLEDSQIRSLGRRLHFTASALRDIRAASKLYSDISTLARGRSSAVASRLAQFPDAAVYAVSLATSGSQQHALQEYLSRWKHVRPLTTGHDLKALGIPPGPAYRKILGRLRADRIDGLINDAEQERARLRQLLPKSTRAPAKPRARVAARKVVTKAQ